MREETPYDTSKYQMQPNPVLEDAGGVKLAENEKEVLLLELFPLVAKNYLTGVKKARYAAAHAAEAAKAAQTAAAAPAAAPAPEAKAEAKPAVAITGNVVTSPMPGRILSVLVKPGDKVTKGQDVVILEAMKMENSITSDYARNREAGARGRRRYRRRRQPTGRDRIAIARNNLGMCGSYSQ